MRLAAAIGAFGLMLAASWCRAQTRGPEGSDTWGAVAASCGVFLDAAQKGNAMLWVTWTQGYLTGSNAILFHDPGTKLHLRYVDPQSIDAYLQKFCRDNPLQRVVDGALALVGDSMPPSK